MIDERYLIEELENWKSRLDKENDDILLVVLDLVMDKVKSYPVVDKWRRCGVDDNPCKKGDYLVCFPSGYMEVVEFENEKFWEGRDEVLPLAWMELPEKCKLTVKERLFGRSKD